MPRWPTRTLAMRFWTKVFVPGYGYISDPGDVPQLAATYADVCWEWRGARNYRGYGHFQITKGHVVRCNRLALELAGRPQPDDLPYSLHKCDNPSCVNPGPQHLNWGNQPENMKQMWLKGRHTEPKKIELFGVQGELEVAGG